MKISRVESWSVPVEQETPYAVAYGDFGPTTLVFLRIETDRGLIGYGSAGCDEAVTGETAESVLAALTETAEPILKGAHPLLNFRLLREVQGALGAQTSALAAVDMALFDIVGKHVELPLWKWLGGDRDRIATSVTIGILPEAETIAAAQSWIGQGFTILKLKGGRDVESDIARVRRVRETVGPDVELRFDANQGYSVANALHFARQTQSARVAFLEQPTLAEQPELLGQVRAARLIPVMADESLHGPESAFQLAQREQVDMFNVKLMKSGGIAAATRIEAIARAANLPIMIGCMDESALGIAAGLHFALSSPIIQHADLDGHLGLIGDPAAGGLRLENGILFAPDKPGLGIEPRHD